MIPLHPNFSPLSRKFTDQGNADKKDLGYFKGDRKERFSPGVIAPCVK
jgi:hypothetical protein